MTTGPALVQSLQSRRLFSADVVSHVLTIDGTVGDDLIVITCRGVGRDGVVSASQHAVFIVTVNDTRYVFSASRIRSVSVDGEAGDDVIELGGNSHFGGPIIFQRPTAVNVPAVVDGGAGDDSISGGSSDDTLRGGDGNDTLLGEAGDDSLDGGDGDDLLGNYLAEPGDDTLTGGDGNDSLNGGFGDDRLAGGRGDDVLNGYTGDDIVTGNLGRDSFNLNLDPSSAQATDYLRGVDSNLGGSIFLIPL